MDIASIRRAAGLDQAAFAKRLGLSHGYISHLETGVRKPSIKLAVKIEREFNVAGVVDAVIAAKMQAAA